jgi:hypothetical protein
MADPFYKPPPPSQGGGCGCLWMMAVIAGLCMLGGMALHGDLGSSFHRVMDQLQELIRHPWSS